MLLSATFESLKVSKVFGRALTLREIIKILDDFFEKFRQFFYFCATWVCGTFKTNNAHPQLYEQLKKLTGDKK